MISVVIPSYNRRDAMLALLADLYRQEGVAFEIIVVDDCSPDDSVAAIRREFPSVRLLTTETNAGPSVARNRGIREARGQWIAGFDSDVTISDAHLLERIAGRFRGIPGVDGVALRILTANGEGDDIARWWHPQEWKTHANCAFFTSYFSGTAYAFRREALLGAGMFPEILYMHYEEVEVAWRILDAGGRILYAPDLVVSHHANPMSRRSEVEVFFKPRNQLLLAVSCLPWSSAIRYVIPRMVYQALKAAQRRHLSDFGRAMLSAAHLLPRQLALRKPLRPSTLRTIRALNGPAAIVP